MPAAAGHEEGDGWRVRGNGGTAHVLLMTRVLYTPVHSLIDQSLHARLGAETTNGDGFGLGWYDAR